MIGLLRGISLALALGIPLAWIGLPADVSFFLGAFPVPAVMMLAPLAFIRNIFRERADEAFNSEIERMRTMATAADHQD